MKKIFFTSIIATLCLISTYAQSYQSAESVEYDPINKQWLVSNGNNIITDDGYGNLGFFGSGSGAFGMEVLGNNVFVINAGGGISVYDLDTEMLLTSYDVPGAGFLNGMTNDGVSNIYVTDFSNDKIHRIDVSDLNNISSEEIVSNTASTPNGIVYDGENNRLIFVNWGSNAPIKAVDLSDNSVSTILNTNLGNIDGIDEDNDGNYYLASWSPAQISKFDKDFANPLEVISTPFISSPADIGYSLENDTLGIPISNDVVFVSFVPEDTTTTSVLDLTAEDFDFIVYPNPVSHQSYVQFELNESQAVKIEVLNTDGKAIRTLMEGRQSAGTHRVLFAGHDLPAGVYYCRLEVGELGLVRSLVVL